MAAFEEKPFCAFFGEGTGDFASGAVFQRKMRCSACGAGPPRAIPRSRRANQREPGAHRYSAERGSGQAERQQGILRRDGQARSGNAMGAIPWQSRDTPLAQPLRQKPRGPVSRPPLRPPGIGLGPVPNPSALKRACGMAIIGSPGGIPHPCGFSTPCASRRFRKHERGEDARS